jgi:hypothetical protein
MGFRSSKRISGAEPDLEWRRRRGAEARASTSRSFEQKSRTEISSEVCRISLNTGGGGRGDGQGAQGKMRLNTDRTYSCNVTSRRTSGPPSTALLRPPPRQPRGLTCQPGRRNDGSRTYPGHPTPPQPPHPCPHPQSSPHPHPCSHPAHCPQPHPTFSQHKPGQRTCVP